MVLASPFHPVFARRSVPFVHQVAQAHRQPTQPRRGYLRLAFSACGLLSVFGSIAATAKQAPSATLAVFRKDIVPILEDYCYDCHGNGSAKGKVTFDELSEAELMAHTELWYSALKNVRANIMPPVDKPQPSPEEVRQLTEWIKYSAFGIDPQNPDPGRITLRRLNRVEYGRTIRTLLGVDFPSEVEFPPDDTGHGFDNIGDVHSL